MKVVLLNKNPAVSRLIGLSVDKLGYDFKEISSKDDISGKIDILVIDSEIEGFDSGLTLFADHTVFLVPKSLEKRPTGGEILEKPFLPTKFIEIIESFSNDSFADISSKSTEELKFDDFEDVMDDIEMPENIGNDLETNNQDESLENISQDIKDENNLNDELNSENFNSMHPEDSKENIDDLFENDDLIEVDDEKEPKNTDETQENLQEEILGNTQDTDEIDEISSIIDEIDNMGDDTDNNGDVLEIEEKENTLEENQEENKEDVINGEQNLIDNQDDMLKDEHLKQEDLQEHLDENDLLQEHNEAECENSKSILENDEINSDENINENLPEEHNDLKENLQNDEILDEITEQTSEDIQEVEKNEELEIENKADDKQIPNANIQNIDDITEQVMKVALNEEVSQDSKNSALNVHDEIDIKDDCVKQTIANKISEEINSTLSQSSIKEALKNMKININITFEDK